MIESRSIENCRYLLGLSIFVLIWGLYISPARAFERPIAPQPVDVVGGRASQPCSVAWALTGLTTDERSLLHDVCRGRKTPGVEFQGLIFRLVSYPDWRAAALGDLLAGYGPSWAISSKKTQQEQTQVDFIQQRLTQRLVGDRILQRAEANKQDPCAGILDNVHNYIDDIESGNTPPPPFVGYELTAEGEKCFGFGPKVARNIAFLTIRVQGLHDLFVVSGSTSGASLRWLNARDFIEFDGHRWAVVAVPMGAPVTIRGRVYNQELPRIWHGFVTHDQTIWDRPFSLGCLTISTRANQNTTLLVDGTVIATGQTLRDRTVGLPPGTHDITALECFDGVEGRECRIRYRESLNQRVRTTTQNLCEDIRLDLNQRDTVSILEARATSRCSESMVWDGMVRLSAASYLQRNERRTGSHYKDLEAYAALTGALRQLKQQLNPREGKSMGATTGADGLDLLGTAAKEAWRQGIDTLISFELRCIPATEVRPWRFSIGVRAVSVREVFRRQRGDLEGLDLSHFIREESIGFSEFSQLHSSIDRALDRLFGLAHVRILEGTREYESRDAATVKLAVYRGDRLEPSKPSGSGSVNHQEVSSVAPPHVEIRRVGGQDWNARPHVCGRLEDPKRDIATTFGQAKMTLTQRAQRWGAKVHLQPSDEIVDVGSARDGNVYVARIQPSRPGTYLAVVHTNDGKVGDATCFLFTAKASGFWGELGLTGDRLYYSTIAGGTNVLYARALLGYTWYRPLRWLGYGISGGYAYTRHSFDYGYPGWSDINADPVGRHEAFDIRHHSLLLGPHIEVRGRWPVSPVDLRARLTPALDMAVVDISPLATDIKEFIGSSRTVDQELFDVDFNLSLDLGLSYPVGPVTVGHWLMFGLHAVNDMTQATRAVVTNDAGLFMGFALTLGGGK